MELLKFGESEVSRLKALRDNYKYQLNLIFAYNNKAEMTYNQKSLFDIAKYTLALEPLDTADMLSTINYILDGYSAELSENEIQETLKRSHGFPGKARELILGKMLGEAKTR